MEKEVFVESIASTGAGVATLEEDGHKRAVFIPFSCPGDQLRIKITQQHKKYYNAEIDQIIKPSHLREPPKCKHYRSCGGCNLLHMNYEAQVEYKRRILEFMFKGFYDKPITTVAGESDNYRKKMRIIADGKQSGYRKLHSHELQPVSECRLVTKALLDEIKSHREKMGEYIIIESNEGITSWPAQQTISRQDIETKVAPLLSYHSLGKTMHFAPTSFIQSNTKLNERLVEEVIVNIAAKKPKRTLELFSGIGNFTAHLRGSVIAVEGDVLASYCASINAPDAKHICADVSGFLEQDKNIYDLILLDPPRTGLAPGTIDVLCDKAKTIVYVSCNPSELKKDVKAAIAKGKVLKKLTLVDMFPHTAHMEIVAVLD